MSKAMDKQTLLGENPAKKSRRRILAAAVVIAAAAGGAAWWHFGSGAAKPSYATQALTTGNITVTVTATGTLNPVRSVSIGSELSGIVAKVNVDVNSTVKAGDVLIELDTAKLESAVNQARAALSSAKAQLGEANATVVEAKAKMARLEELNRTSGGKLPSRTELDEQRAIVLKAEASVASAKASIEDASATLETQLTNLSKASIKSPVDGVVLTRSVEPGYAVAASLQAVELLTVATDLRELELKADIDEADVGQVAPGQGSDFTVAAFPDRKFEARLSKVAYGATTNETTKVVTYTGYFNVPNKELLLRPGMTATATIETARRDNVLLVPNTAFRFRPKTAVAASSVSFMMPPPRTRVKQVKERIQQAERERTVYVLKDGAAQAVTIRTGLTDGKMTEVLSGDIKAGDKVITQQLKSAAGA